LPYDGKERHVVVDVQELLLGSPTDPQSHPTLAFFTRARRFSISRMGTASIGSRRRERTRG
jgi:hypothetical protein